MTDKEFPCTHDSINKGDHSAQLDQMKKQIEWKHAEQAGLIANGRLFDEISPSDMVMSTLFDDSNFVASLAAVSCCDQLVARLFAQSSFSPIGLTTVRFFKGGKWRDVSVDDMIPVHRPTGRPIFAMARSRHPYVALIEKAYAKLHGSYGVLSKVPPSVVMADLTGGMTVRYDAAEREKLWARVHTCCQHGLGAIVARVGGVPCPIEKAAELAGYHIVYFRQTKDGSVTVGRPDLPVDEAMLLDEYCIGDPQRRWTTWDMFIDAADGVEICYHISEMHQAVTFGEWAPGQAETLFACPQHSIGVGPAPTPRRVLVRVAQQDPFVGHAASPPQTMHLLVFRGGGALRHTFLAADVEVLTTSTRRDTVAEVLLPASDREDRLVAIAQPESAVAGVYQLSVAASVPVTVASVPAPVGSTFRAGPIMLGAVGRRHCNDPTSPAFAGNPHFVVSLMTAGGGELAFLQSGQGVPVLINIASAGPADGGALACYTLKPGHRTRDPWHDAPPRPVTRMGGSLEGSQFRVLMMPGRPTAVVPHRLPPGKYTFRCWTAEPRITEIRVMPVG